MQFCCLVLLVVYMHAHFCQYWTMTKLKQPSSRKDEVGRLAGWERKITKIILIRPLFHDSQLTHFLPSSPSGTVTSWMVQTRPHAVSP